MAFMIFGALSLSTDFLQPNPKQRFQPITLQNTLDKISMGDKMYSTGSLECLKNAMRILHDAKVLIRKKSFGTAQSLGVTALEEVGKALILELANLNHAGKDLVKQAMKGHIPKKVIIKAIEEGLVLRGNIAREPEIATIKRKEMDHLLKMLKNDVDSLESKRQKGFYVQVNVENGRIENSPLTMKEVDVEDFIKEVDFSFRLGTLLVSCFRAFKHSDDDMLNNLLILRDELGKPYISYDLC